jgi:integrase
LALRAALTQAVRWRWVPTNVAAMTSPATPRRPPRSGMTSDDVRAVIAAARGVDPAAEIALRIAAVAGLRRGEIAALQWAAVEGARLTVDTAAVVERQDGITSVVVAPTKTANRRVITIDDETAGLIETLREERSELGPWLFGPGTEPPHPDRIGWWWRRARALAGIDAQWRLHDLRHWSATTAIGKGHDVRTVANRLGHANAAMTLGVYAHAVPSADQALARTIGDVLSEGPPPLTRS